MEAQVEVISREIIKPSSPTPDHLRKLKLSYLDQLIPPVYMPPLFFYESKGVAASNHARICRRLKESLSRTLPSFYPLAGRLKDDYVIVCNDAGAEFVEARFPGDLMDVVREPDVEKMMHYFPLDPTAVVAGLGRQTPLLLVQITFFGCGGFALGVCFSHKVADFASVMTFVNAWAAASRGDDHEVEKSLGLAFSLASHFPPSWLVWLVSRCRISGYLIISDEEKPTMMTRRFVFDKEKISALKQVVAAAASSTFSSESPSSTTVKDPTRVEVVSAFIWKRFIEASESEKPGAKPTWYALHAVNLKNRTNPPQLLENVIGNCIMPAIATSDCVQDLQGLVGKLRGAIRKIRGDYITKALKLMSKESYLRLVAKMFFVNLMGKLEFIVFTSWCGFPMYDADYGWGSPIWCSSAAWAVKNLVVLVSSRNGEDIEAIVTMTPDKIRHLETQINLIASDKND